MSYSTTDREIENNFAQGDWNACKRLLNLSMKKNPPNAWDNHWYYAIMSSVLYEQGEYEEALVYARKAYRIAPRCPMVLWELAGVLYRRKNYKRAEKHCLAILSRDLEVLAYGECGEGIGWSKSIMNGCRLMLARIYCLQKKYPKSLKYYREHLSNRQRGILAWYSKRQVEKELKYVEEIIS